MDQITVHWVIVIALATDVRTFIIVSTAETYDAPVPKSVVGMLKVFWEPIQPKLIQILYLQTLVTRPTISHFRLRGRGQASRIGKVLDISLRLANGMEAIFPFIALRGFLVKPIV